MLPALIGLVGRGAAARGAGAMLAKSGKQKIGNISALFMLLAAVITDCAQFVISFLYFGTPVGLIAAAAAAVSSFLGIPNYWGVGFVIPLFLGFIMVVVFAFWFKQQGVEYFGGRMMMGKMGLSFSTAVAEMAPFFGAFFSFTLGVLGMIMLTRLEDE